jgi:hypothetical protein
VEGGFAVQQHAGGGRSKQNAERHGAKFPILAYRKALVQIDPAEVSTTPVELTTFRTVDMIGYWKREQGRGWVT